jgi:ligand-binding SRPBCC domain-containing protein
MPDKPTNMKEVFQYKAEQFLPIDIDRAWAFFSSPKNLALITPPDMKFKIRTALNDEEIYEGMLIDYTVRPLFGIPMYWQTEICKIEKPFIFTDRQTKGPYSLWEHTHRFSETAKGTFMEDEVNYKLPLGFIGTLTHSLLVQKRIEDIFNYRKKTLLKLFESHGNNLN